MKKRISLIMTLVLLTLCLTGCGSKDVNAIVDISFSELGEIVVDGKTTTLTKYNGYEAERINPNGEHIMLTLEQCDDLSMAARNTFNVIQDEMTVYKGECYAWSMYLGTDNVLYYPYCTDKEGLRYWISTECWNVGAEQAYTYEYEIASNLTMTNNGLKVDLGSMIVTSEWDTITVASPTDKGGQRVVVGSSLKIVPGESELCTETTTVLQGEDYITLGFYSDDVYQVYTYGGYTIQSLYGVNLTDYIEFK